MKTFLKNQVYWLGTICMFVLLALLAGYALPARAGLPPTSAKGVAEANKVTTFNLQAPANQLTTTGAATRMVETGNTNLLANPGFEGSTLLSGWTNTNGTCTADTTNYVPDGGKQSASCALTAVTGNVLSQSFVVPGTSADSYNVAGSMWVKTASTTVQVCVSVASVEQQCTSVPSTNVMQLIVATATAVGGQTVAVYSKTTGSTTGTVIYDAAYGGWNQNIGTVQQAYFYGGMEQAGASGCTYSQNTSSGLNNFIDLGAGTGCSAWTTAGNVTAVGTNDHRFTLPIMPAGQYKITFAGLFQTNNQLCQYRLSDGTNVYQSQGVQHQAAVDTGVPSLTFDVSISSAQGSTTFKIQSADSGSSACTANNSAAGLNLAWKIYYFPSASSIVTANPTVFFPTYSARVSSAGVVSSESQDFINGNCAIANTSDFTCTWNTNFFSVAPNCTLTALDSATAAPIIKVLTQPTTTSVVAKTYNDAATATAYGFNISCQATVPASTPAPLIANAVVSPSAGVKNTVNGLVTCSAAPSVVGDGGISAVGARSTTSCALTIPAATFSATPWSCNVTVNSTTVQAMGCVCASATSCTIYGPNADYSASVSIVGPK